MEVWLTSEDLGAYGRDIDVTLPELLWQLVEVIPDNGMLRLGMTNPPYIMEHLEVTIATDSNHGNRACFDDVSFYLCSKCLCLFCRKWQRSCFTPVSTPSSMFQFSLAPIKC